MTELQFREIVREAMKEEYKWVPQPEELDYEYTFSKEFEKKMQEMIRENTMHYIRIGKHAFRKMAVVIVAAVLMMALVACGIYLGINWNEVQNDEQGTLDITFDINDPNGVRGEFEYKRPEIPVGFKVAKENEYPLSLEIEYENDNGNVIYYDQTGSVETMGISIDNENNELQEITLNGYRGYIAQKGKNSHIIWTDGISCFELFGNVDKALLIKIAETVK